MRVTYTYYRRYNYHDPTELADFMLDAAKEGEGVEVEALGQVDRDSYELVLRGEEQDVRAVVVEDGGEYEDVEVPGTMGYPTISADACYPVAGWLAFLMCGGWVFVPLGLWLLWVVAS